jgi:hypothetical protein
MMMMNHFVVFFDPRIDVAQKKSSMSLNDARALAAHLDDIDAQLAAHLNQAALERMIL